MPDIQHNGITGLFILKKRLFSRYYHGIVCHKIHTEMILAAFFIGRRLIGILRRYAVMSCRQVQLFTAEHILSARFLGKGDIACRSLHRLCFLRQYLPLICLNLIGRLRLQRRSNAQKQDCRFDEQDNPHSAFPQQG